MADITNDVKQKGIKLYRGISWRIEDTPVKSSTPKQDSGIPRLKSWYQDEYVDSSSEDLETHTIIIEPMDDDDDDIVLERGITMDCTEPQTPSNSQKVIDGYEYLKEVDEMQSIHGYIDQHPDLSWEDRKSVVTWIIQTHTQNDMPASSLYLAINILDTFLSLEDNFNYSNLDIASQLALYIACKHEDSSFSLQHNWPEEEQYMLEKLDYNLTMISPLNFLETNEKNETRMVAEYLAELTLLDWRYLQVKNENVAHTAFNLAQMVLGLDCGDPISNEEQSMMQGMVDLCLTDNIIGKKSCHLQAEKFTKSWIKQQN